jgi:hypothetical protein
VPPEKAMSVPALTTLPASILSDAVPPLDTERCGSAANDALAADADRPARRKSRIVAEIDDAATAGIGSDVHVIRAQRQNLAVKNLEHPAAVVADRDGGHLIDVTRAD